MSAFKIIKKRWYLFIPLFLTIGFFIWQNFIVQPQIKSEKTYKVKKQTLKEELTLSGEIDANEKVTVRFQTSGKLAWVGVKKGDFVKKYQTLASLDQTEVKKNLEKTLYDYSKERWDFQEDKDVTYKSSVPTDSVRRILEKNQFDLNKAVLDVELKQLSIQLSTLFSPIEGIVTRVSSPYAGVNTTPSQAEFDIVNPKTIYFSANADQIEVVKLKINQKAEIILDPYPDKNIKGVINSISFTPKDGETGTVYELKISLSENNPDNKYLLGMTGDANFILKEKKNIIGIPENFINSDKKGKYVFIKENKNKIKKYIKTGEEIDSYVQILDGLNEKEVIYD